MFFYLVFYVVRTDLARARDRICKLKPVAVSVRGYRHARRTERLSELKENKLAERYGVYYKVVVEMVYAVHNNIINFPCLN